MSASLKANHNKPTARRIAATSFHQAVPCFGGSWLEAVSCPESIAVVTINPFFASSLKDLDIEGVEKVSFIYKKIGH